MPRARSASPSWLVLLLRAPVLLSLVIAATASLVLVGTGAGSSQAAPLDRPGPIPSVVPAPRIVEPPPIADVEPPAVPGDGVPTGTFAEVAGLALHLPSSDTILAGFHQASTPGSLKMSPRGETGRVLPSRGRAYPRTSAVDLVVPDGEPVRSPVTGRVVVVESYSLYGRHPDQRVTIRPKGHSRLNVVLLHVEDVQVEVGDRVEAGTSPIARTGRRLPFRSQVDEQTAPHAWPHIHLEVKRR